MFILWCKNYKLIHHIFIFLQKPNQILCKYFGKEREKNEISLVGKETLLGFCSKMKHSSAKFVFLKNQLLSLKKYYNPVFTNGTRLKRSALANHEKVPVTHDQ